MPTVAELTVEVDLDGAAEVEAGLARLDALLKELGSGTTDINLDADTAEVRSELDWVRQTLAEIDSLPTTAEVEVDTGTARADLAAFQAALDALEEKITTEVDLDAAEARAELAALKAMLDALADETVNVDLDVGAAQARIAELEALLKAIPDETVTVEVDTDRATSNLTQLTAAASRAATQINAMTFLALTLGPALLPTLAAATVAAGALGAGFVAAGLALGVFGAVAATNFSDINQAYDRITQAEKAYALAVTDQQKEAALERIKAAMDSLEPSEQRMLQAVLDLRDSWRDFATQFQPQVFDLATQAMETLSSQFPILQAAMESLLPSLETLGQQFDAALNGPFWQEFLTNMAELSGPLTENLLTSLGNIAEGIAGILDAFLPMSVDMTQGLEDLTAKFKAWGTSLEDNPGFKSFIEYVKTNWPEAKRLIESVWDALVALAKAAEPIGTTIAAAVRRFADAITYLGETNPDLLTAAIGLTILGVALVNLLGPLLAVSRLFVLFANPIGAIVGGLILLGGAFAVAYENVPAFASAVDNALSVLKDFGAQVGPIASGAGRAIAEAFQDSIRWIQTNWGPAFDAVADDIKQGWTDIKDWFVENGDLFKDVGKILVRGGRALGSLFGEIGSFLRSMWDGMWDGFVDIAQGIWTGILGTIRGILTMIGGLIQAFLGLATGNWSAAWNGLKDVVRGAFTAVASEVIGGIQVIWGVIQVFGGLLSGIWSYLWTPLSGVVQGALDAVSAVISAWWGFVSGIFSFIGQQISEAWNAIWNGFDEPVVIAVTLVQNIFGTLAGFLFAIFQVIITNIGTWMTGMQTGISTGMTAIQTVWTTTWNLISTVVTTVWTAIMTIIQTAMTLIQTVITVGMTAIQTLWTTAWTLMSTVLTTIWTAMQTIVQTAWTAIQTLITTGLTLLQTLWTTAWTLMSTTLTTIWTAMQTTVQTIWTAIQTLIQTGLTAIQTAWTTAWTAILQFLIQTWNSILTNITTFTQQILQVITTWVVNLLQIWQQFWTDFLQAIQEGAVQAISAITNMLNTIISTITSFVGQMFNAGVALIQGFIDGLLSMAGAVGDAMGQVMSAAGNFVPGSPAKEGPFSGRGYTRLRGQRMMDDLATGMEDRRFDLGRVTGDLMDLASLRLTPERAYNAITAPVSGASVQVAPGAVVVQVGSGDVAAARAAFGTAGDDLADAILDRLRRQ